MICEGREDLHYSNLSITERLILKHISWRVSMIADPKEIERYYTDAIATTYSQYEPLRNEDDEFGYFDDEGEGLEQLIMVCQFYGVTFLCSRFGILYFYFSFLP